MSEQPISDIAAVFGFGYGGPKQLTPNNANLVTRLRAVVEETANQLASLDNKLNAETGRADAIEEALQSMLNVEGAALAGGKLAAWCDLDIRYHFTKARDALAAYRK